MVAAGREAFGAIDIVVNNAGVSLPAALEADDWLAAWDATFAVNLTAQALMVRAGIKSRYISKEKWELLWGL